MFFTRGSGAMLPGKILNFGLQKWRFLDFEHKFPITSAINVVNISKGIVISLPGEMGLNRIKI